MNQENHCNLAQLSAERSVNRLRKCFMSDVLSLQWEGEKMSVAEALGSTNLVTEYIIFVCIMLFAV